MARTGACRWFLLFTMPCALFSEIGIWNINTSKFVILSNFAHLTTWSSFQPIICILLDLFLIYFKANIQISEHPLGILMFWYSKQRLKIAVVNWRVLSTSRQHITAGLTPFSTLTVCPPWLSCLGTELYMIWWAEAVPHSRKLSWLKP